VILDPGIHAGLRRAEYAEIAAWNQSILKLIPERSPAHAYQAYLEPKTPTPAMTIGDAIHRVILEPHRLHDLVQRAPTQEKRSNADKAAWADVRNMYPEAIVLRPTGSDREPGYDEVIRISEAVWAHPTAAALLRGAKTELTVVWTDPVTGLACKSRVDAFNRVDGWPTVVDLKTAEDASPARFPWACERYGYHFQGAHYLAGLDELAPLQRRFVMVVVEKSPPHAVACYELSPASLELGQHLVRAALDTCAKCVEAGEWPAYPVGIQSIVLPERAFRVMDEGF